MLFWWGRQTPRYIEPERIWSVARGEAQSRGLDPRFVFAIVMAESGGNANAQSDVARGMMQLTADTWAATTEIPYNRAYDWPTNLSVGTQHLADLRDRLEAKGRFTYPRLAVAYRYGYGAILKRKFEVSHFQNSSNRIYRRLFRGTIPEPSELGL